MKVTIVGMLTALVLIGLVAFAFYRFSGSLGGAFGLLTSPMTLSITTLALEVVDFVSDALACSNVLNDVRYENFRTAYIFLTTIVSIVFLFGFVERISNVAWQWRKHRSKIKRKMINALSGMARTFRSGSVVMDVDSELRPIKKKNHFGGRKTGMNSLTISKRHIMISRLSMQGQSYCCAKIYPCLPSMHIS